MLVDQMSGHALLVVKQTAEQEQQKVQGKYWVGVAIQVCN